MRTAEQLREALHTLDHKTLDTFSKQELADIIDSDDDEMHPAHSIIGGIVSLRHNPKETSTEETDIEKAYKCIKILTQKYSPFLELEDATGNTLRILYSSQDLTAKEAVLKLLLDSELNIPAHQLFLKNNQPDATLPTQHSVGELISKDVDFLIPKINSLEIFERFKVLDILPDNSKDINGKTILHHEFALSSLDVFKALIERGVELVPDSEGKTPYEIAEESNKQDIVQYIKERVNKYFAKGVLTRKLITSQDVLEIIAVHGFNTFINATGDSPTEYLKVRSSYYTWLSVNLIALLLKHDADVNSRDVYGKTPLHWFACNGHTEAAEFLIAKGDNVNSRESSGKTPLHLAARKGHKEIAKLLVLNGADIDAEDKQGRTPLLWAAIDGHTKVVEFLLKHGADVHKRNKDGISPKEVALTEDIMQIIEDAIKAKAEHNRLLCGISSVALCSCVTASAAIPLDGIAAQVNNSENQLPKSACISPHI